MSEYFGNIKNFVKNPLGILALFIVMLYGIASLFFGLSNDLFNENQKWVLLIFIVVFPFVVFWGFYSLVTKHHKKLYSPNDFKTDEGWLKTLDQEQQHKKLSLEAKNVIKEQNISKKSVADKDSESPAVKSNIILSEDLVIRELESEYGVNIRRHVGESVDYGFDGHFLYRNMEVLVEIKYTEIGNWELMAERLKPQLKYLETKNFVLRPYFLVVIISNGLTKEQLEKGKEIIVKSLNSFSIKVKCKAYSLEKLKYRYQIKE